MYQINPIRDTAATLNCDVTQDGQYLGRLYVFPTTNPNFIAMGIEKEWFLAHAEGEFVISGYVNTNGEWSLSPHQSLQLSEEYTTQSAIFDRVFSPKYIQDVLISPSLAAKDITVANDSSNNGHGESGEGQPMKFDNKLMVDWNAIIPHLDVLRELLVRKVEQEEFFDQFEEEQPNELATETERLKVQDTLIDAVLQEYRKQETTEFVLPPFGIVTVHAEEEYFVLRSENDGQTILVASLDGEVIEELSQNDAVKFEEVLKQLEVEVTKWLDTNSNLIGRESKQVQDVEYGD
ncbi:hypothetical protein NIES2119_31350 [[Phormidium ambiguum] IAM M-71]|uniref:Uncharacterized protein n=1 Tax=[Phormidium ambiguum] IAM M-71 TaxID=454136 RepID=A0A1U7I2C3_9CYAN|nr:hypothetical protein [Phormidium ambiguum]OKH30231.1 hypothetical protein NIES2119_31350 [Phormidium ambiguum IAM M-71]